MFALTLPLLPTSICVPLLLEYLSVSHAVGDCAGRRELDKGVCADRYSSVWWKRGVSVETALLCLFFKSFLVCLVFPDRNQIHEHHYHWPGYFQKQATCLFHKACEHSIALTACRCEGWKRAAECYREISVFYCMDVEGGVGLGWFQCAGHGAALHPKQLQEFWMRSKEVFLSCRVLTSSRATIRASQPHAAALWVPLEGPLGSKTFVSVRVSMASSLRRRWGSGTCKSQKLKKQESRISDPEATNYTEGDGCDFSLTQFPSPTFTGDTCVLWAWILPEQDGNGNSSNRDLSWNGQRFWQAVKLYLGGGETGRWKEESELGSSYLFFLHPVIQSEFSRI